MEKTIIETINDHLFNVNYNPFKGFMSVHFMGTILSQKYRYIYNTLFVGPKTFKNFIKSHTEQYIFIENKEYTNPNEHYLFCHISMNLPYEKWLISKKYATLKKFHDLLLGANMMHLIIKKNKIDINEFIFIWNSTYNIKMLRGDVLRMISGTKNSPILFETIDDNKIIYLKWIPHPTQQVEIWFKMKKLKYMWNERKSFKMDTLLPYLLQL
jgi:hypothetical protein